jgi:hypothetical protein
MRQYGDLPPVLSSPPNAPAVSATSGLGTGGGAGVETPIGSGYGYIYVTAGSGAASSGSVTLSFTANPPQLFFSCDQELGSLNVTGQTTNTVVINFSGAALLARKIYKIYYEWNVSQ